MARAPDPVLLARPNHELLEIATSKNYGKSTREAARGILADRGVTIDAQTFANPSAGNVPARPPATGARAFGTLLRIVIGLALILLAMYLRVKSRSH